MSACVTFYLSPGLRLQMQSASLPHRPFIDTFYTYKPELEYDLIIAGFDGFILNTAIKDH